MKPRLETKGPGESLTTHRALSLFYSFTLLLFYSFTLLLFRSFTFLLFYSFAQSSTETSARYSWTSPSVS
ncbi:hypothetical protein FIV42_26260 [Persicimonas caeni]|uniref:Uncharacterized protein n=1 Tax=Persicimonas caeni TaxID=2292766 RepID=A0A4Y6Q0K0_PERCE|nr:hypothetical protein FIV42_26260 [Persicimonas caeni]QED35339.1 hypothetical protein FRD00_26255 [Persicimonas caeni]